MSCPETEIAPEARRFSKVIEILDRYGRDGAKLVPILQAVQEEYRYLPEEVITFVATNLGIPPARVFGVATFYSHFALEPKGRFVIRVCDGTACHVRKSIPILEQLRSELGLSDKKVTTDDLGFTVETVSCLGACGLAPVLTVNDKVYPAMTPDKASALLSALKEGLIR